MTTIHFDALISHWESLRNNNAIPFRSQIDPRAIPDLLENIFILENTAVDQFRVRHTGMVLCEMKGFEVRGQNISSMMERQAREKLDLLLGQIVGQPGISELTLSAIDMQDNICTIKMLLLPLRSDFGDVNRILGYITAPLLPYVAPLRFGISGHKFTPIATESQTQNGFAEPQSAFGTEGLQAVSSDNRPIVGSPPKRGHLRLVSNSDQET